jgi:hypothetical protein
MGDHIIWQDKKYNIRFSNNNKVIQKDQYVDDITYNPRGNLYWREKKCICMNNIPIINLTTRLNGKTRYHGYFTSTKLSISYNKKEFPMHFYLGTWKRWIFYIHNEINAIDTENTTNHMLCDAKTVGDIDSNYNIRLISNKNTCVIYGEYKIFKITETALDLGSALGSEIALQFDKVIERKCYADMFIVIKLFDDDIAVLFDRNIDIISNGVLYTKPGWLNCTKLPDGRYLALSNKGLFVERLTDNRRMYITNTLCPHTNDRYNIYYMIGSDLYTVPISSVI